MTFKAVLEPVGQREVDMDPEVIRTLRDRFLALWRRFQALSAEEQAYVRSQPYAQGLRKALARPRGGTYPNG